MKPYLKAYLTSMAALLVFSCGKEDVKPEPEAEPLILKAEKGVVPVTINEDGNEATIEFDTQKSFAVVDVETALKWEFTTDASAEEWCSVEYLGDGLKIAVATNNTSELRQTRIAITNSGEEKAAINISQKGVVGETEFIISQNEVDIPDNGGSIVLHVMTNLESWTAETTSEASWLTVTSDAVNNTITLSAKENSDSDAKKVILKVKGLKNDQEIVAKEIPITLWEPSLVFEYTTTSNNTKITLPLYGELDLKISWGDTKEFSYIPVKATIKSTEDMKNSLSHDYETPGTYTVRIQGAIQGLVGLTPDTSSPLKQSNLTAIRSWGCNKYKIIYYAFASSQIETLPTDKYAAFSNLVGGEWMFAYCTSLKAVTSGLFTHMTKTQNFDNTFNECSKLESVPEDLFATNTKVTSFASCFCGTNLTAVPASLFSSCPDVESFSFTFSDCPKLTSVPGNLFEKNTKVTNFRSTFEKTGLTSIPEDIFATCPLVTTFNSVLWKSKITAVPAGLFRNNPLVTDFSQAFNSTLITSLPSGLFTNNPEAVNFQSLCYKCTSLETIPAGLFDKCTKATSFNQVFNGCLALKAIPAGLFDKCPLVTNLEKAFKDCKAIVSIPKGLLRPCAAAQSFEYVFSGCEALTTIPEDLFPASGINFDYAFSRCKALTIIPTGLFSENLAATSFYGTFENCVLLEGESPYSVIDGEKVHLYDRDGTKRGFAKAIGSRCFYKCTGLTDYSTMPSDWK